MYLSLQKSACVQRSLVVSPNGNVKLFVHCEEINVNPYSENLDPPMPLDEDTVNSHVDRIVSIVNSVHKMEVCSGYDEVKYQAAWSTCPFGEVDSNPFQELKHSGLHPA